MKSPSPDISLPSPLRDELQVCVGAAYRINREAGKGGMATVFEAEDLKHHRKVAIKVLNPELGATLNVERFLQEIRVTAGLHHPHILPLHDSGACGNLLYYVMPFVDGGSLRARMPPGEQRPVSETVRMAVQVAGALDHAHRHGFVHRDIKPENILLQDGEALIADFGIARVLVRVTDSGTLTTPGLNPGTPAYMSPEQVTGDRELDGRSDIFSLGCVLFEMLAGEGPYSGGDVQSTVIKRVLAPAPSLIDRRRDVPAHVSHVIARALAREPAERFQRASDLAAAIEGRTDGERTGEGRHAIWRNRLWSRRTAVAAGVIAVLAAFGFAVVLQRGRPASAVPPPMSAAAIAVFPFQVHGGGDIQYLREGIPDLLSTNLNGAGDIRSIDLRALLSALRQRGMTTPDVETGRALAVRFGAAKFVMGSVAAAGSRLRIGARLRSTDSSVASTEEVVVEGEGSQLFVLLDSLTTRLIASSDPLRLMPDASGQGNRSPSDRLARTATNTSSLAALKQYLVGASTLRRAHFDSAVTAFKEATEIDTTFALAYYGLSLAAEYATQADLSRASAEQAVRFSARLSPRDRTLVEALVASRRGDAVTADRLYNKILADSPEDVEAWFQLGEVRFHYGPWRGDPIGRSAPAFAQVLKYEPQNVAAHIHLARIAASEGNFRRLDSLVARVTTLAPEGDRTLDMRTLRAFAHRDSAAVRGILAEISNGPDLSVPFITWQLAAYLHDLHGAERVLRIGTRPERPAEWRALAYSIVAHIETGRGRWAASRAALDSLAEIDPIKALEHRALLSLAPFLQTPDAELRSLRDSLERTSPPPPTGGPSRSSLLTVDEQLHPHIRAYLLGLLSARLGDSRAATRWAAQLEQMGRGNDTQEIARDFARSVRAATEKTPSRMLRQLEQMRLQSWYEFAMYSPFYSLADERFARAGLLAAMKREDEALKWLSSFSDFSFFDVRYEAPAHLARARAWRRRGRNDSAAMHYREFLELWRDADPQFLPEVNAARRELSEISGR